VAGTCEEAVYRAEFRQVPEWVAAEFGVELEDDGFGAAAARGVEPDVREEGTNEDEVAGLEWACMGADESVAMAVGDEGEFDFWVVVVGSVEVGADDGTADEGVALVWVNFFKGGSAWGVLVHAEYGQ
jgi:hypothetical protein